MCGISQAVLISNICIYIYMNECYSHIYIYIDDMYGFWIINLWLIFSQVKSLLQSQVKYHPGGRSTVKIGMHLPHEILSSLYHWREGVLFYSLLVGSPHDSWLHATYPMDVHPSFTGVSWFDRTCGSVHQDLEEYWKQPMSRKLALDTWGQAWGICFDIAHAFRIL